MTGSTAYSCTDIQQQILKEHLIKSHHRITEWLRLEGTSGGHPIHFPYSSRAI